MWVKKNGSVSVKDFDELLSEISERTGLSISLDGIYKWVAFLPSRQNRKVPVANRYFGVFQGGEIKMRGIETRRHDTPPFITRTQIEILQRMANIPANGHLTDVLPGVRMLLRKKIRAIREHKIPFDEFVIRHTMSRASDQYRGFSPAAEAVRQLEKAGKSMRPGQSVRFVYILGQPGVMAWDLHPVLDASTLDTSRYVDLLLRSMETVLTPLGISRKKLEEWLFDGVFSVPLQGVGVEIQEQQILPSLCSSMNI
jgi:DNA polymerase-2